MTIEDMIKQILEAVRNESTEHQREHRDPEDWGWPAPAPELARFVRIENTIKEAKRQYDLAQIAASPKQ